MTANRPPGRRTAAIATAAAAVLLTAGLATGCDEVNGSQVGSSLDCLTNAGTIADSLKAIHEAGLDAANDPAQTEESIDTVEKNLDKIDDGTNDDKVVRAVDDLRAAIEDYNKAILNGDTSPDSSKVDAAADALGDVCTAQ
ncbi:hypothetical protein PV682_41985 [Streptomyces niveiscabiei]|uniref:hypothetical protein n=1 Tax=Streptomyces niveiscabiei TaxID=164115 RepID=UPI0029B89F8E|nr:hypothetical protein [Streptomyces niveiscabiei]MDX3387967.1 hypothetical protein [Streptomyces niveiscabiei]